MQEETGMNYYNRGLIKKKTMPLTGVKFHIHSLQRYVVLLFTVIKKLN